MSGYLIWKMVSTFFVKNWKAFVVAAVLGSMLWIFCDWRGQAAEIAALEYEVKQERTISLQWRDVSRLQSAKALEAAKLRDEFERRLMEKLGEPPAVIFKPAEPEIITIIQEAEDCTAAVSGVGARMRDLMKERDQ